MFSGTPGRLKELLPELRDRRHRAFRRPLARIPIVSDIRVIDAFMPTPPSVLLEAEFEPTRGRH